VIVASRSALITGLSGPRLTPAEHDFLASYRPAGIILFARNLVEHGQIRRLVADARQAIDAPALVLIDQEGGRVQRLRPPLGRALPPARAFAAAYPSDTAAAAQAAGAVARLLAEDLRSLGIDCNCAPVLDRPVPGAHEIIGDRAYGSDADTIVAIGGAVAEGLMAGGVLPVMKHVPGHGRANADSHLALPIVTATREELEATDFEPFRRLAHLPAAMTAHVVYASLDSEAPASTSARVTSEIIRGHIGFDGLLMSDDLGMKALTGPMHSRAAAVIAAGSDVALHCSGVFSEMEDAVKAVPLIAAKAAVRLERALAICARGETYDRLAAEQTLATVLAAHARQAESV